jgi:hypothetical protein
MHHFSLGIFEKKGRSRAEDIVDSTEGILNSYELSYTNLVCIATGTAAPMIKSGRLLKHNPTQAKSSGE